MFPSTKLSMRNSRCKIGYVLGLLMHNKVVVEFGGKVFLIDCLIMKNIKYGKNKHNRTRSSFFMHSKTTNVTI